MAGHLWVYSVLGATGNVDVTNLLVTAYKNGVAYRLIGGAHSAHARKVVANGGTVVPLAAGDFVEVYATYFATSGTAGITLISGDCSFTGYWIRR